MFSTPFHPRREQTFIFLSLIGRVSGFGGEVLVEGITDGRDKSDPWTSAESRLYHQFQPQPQGTAFKSVTVPDGDPICCPLGPWEGRAGHSGTFQK